MKKAIPKQAIYIAATLLFVIVYRYTTSANTKANTRQKSFLKISEAKEFAYSSPNSEQNVTVKGIYTAMENWQGGHILFLEDKEPKAMEDIPFFCIYNQSDSAVIKDLEIETELVISGIISKTETGVQLTNCNIVSINKGTMPEK
jgi:hypothetical protein